MCELDKKSNIEQIEKALKISEDWSQENLLYFNVDKTVYMSIGAAKVDDLEITLYGKSLQRARKAKLLGLTVDQGRNDPFTSARLNSKNLFTITFLKLKNMLGNASYYHTCIVYYTYYLNSGLYSSEIFSNYKPDFNVFRDKKPSWLQKADLLYKKLFSNKKPTKKDKERSSIKLSPPTPSQTVIKKDLYLIFDVVSNDSSSTIRPDEILGTFKTYAGNRSGCFTHLKNSLLAVTHSEKISLIGRYEKLLHAKELPSHPLYAIEKELPKVRRKRIDAFISNRDCYENNLRFEIFQGTHIYNGKKYLKQSL